MGAIKPWSPGKVAEVRRALAAPAHLARGEYREWNWKFGAVYTKTPTRRATCCECGLFIQPGTASLFVVDTETKGGGWTARQRYLHLEPCTPACPRCGKSEDAVPATNHGRPTGGWQFRCCGVTTWPEESA